MYTVLYLNFCLCLQVWFKNRRVKQRQVTRNDSESHLSPRTTNSDASLDFPPSQVHQLATQDKCDSETSNQSPRHCLSPFSVINYDDNCSVMQSSPVANDTVEVNRYDHFSYCHQSRDFHFIPHTSCPEKPSLSQDVSSQMPHSNFMFPSELSQILNDQTFSNTLSHCQGELDHLMEYPEQTVPCLAFQNNIHDYNSQLVNMADFCSVLYPVQEAINVLNETVI